MLQVVLLSTKPNPSSSDSEEWNFEEVEYIVADNESSWVHLKGPRPSYGQSHDQIIGTSGYPGLQDMARSFIHGDTSSSGGPWILTPGTTYPTLRWSCIIDHINRTADDSDLTSRSEAQ
jgi:hypothetical protein